MSQGGAHELVGSVAEQIFDRVRVVPLLDRVAGLFLVIRVQVVPVPVEGSDRDGLVDLGPGDGECFLVRVVRKPFIDIVFSSQALAGDDHPVPGSVYASPFILLA